MTRRKDRTKIGRDSSAAPTLVTGGAAAPASPHPLSWWRTMPAESLSISAAATMREAISAIAILDEPAWPPAAGGDVAAAVGLALRLDPVRASGTTWDLVMTALAACAAEGNAAACLAMSYALRRCPGAGRDQASLATGWQVRCLMNQRERGGDLGGRP